MKVPVSRRALVQRITRKLEPERKLLRFARGQAEKAVGQWYVVKVEERDGQVRSTVIRKHVDLAVLAQELEVLEPWEEFSA